MKPSIRITLYAQPALLIQSALFAVAPHAQPEPVCTHPEAGWQDDLFLGVHYACTFCGTELPEPKVCA